ncbi:MAG: Brp/Blh family beta-carotene 15,15'-dioxygenase [Sphingorhabdus sp.]|uniref:Brp/Blh family beta-carotene 15,15'-dioxygenase n=1 Tax=Sphingorhabdus sp. TaxID=1902408 RepID=UPI0038FCED35
MSINKSTGAYLPSNLRLWALPWIVLGLIITNILSPDLGSPQMTMLAAVAIVLVGIPHGTLDVEIASIRFGRSSYSDKFKILAGYFSCAAIMTLCWLTNSALALTLFLVISIIHFGQDWRGGADIFLAMMVSWALIALPALSHPEEVINIFVMLTDAEAGSTISAILACTAAPAALGSLAFTYWAYKNGETLNAVDVASCLTAALFLPPLIAFAVFFCGLHSPRHMEESLRECSGLSAAKKAGVMAAVFPLAIALGVLLFIGMDNLQLESGVIRSAFILISILTVPHFILEHFKLNRATSTKYA